MKRPRVPATAKVDAKALHSPAELTQEQRTAFARKLFRRDFFAFAKLCLGYDKLYTPHEQWAAEFQRFVLDFKNRVPGYSKRELRLMPRGCYKSTLFTVAGALWILVNNPDARILLYSGSETNAKNFLHEIKKHITQNGRFRQCFGKWDANADKWATTAIVSSRRRAHFKEPTILAIGRGSEITSMHFDYALVDDIVTREDRDSAQSRESTKTAIRDLESIMDPDSIVSLVGTHWHYADAYMWIRRELNPELEAQGKQPWRVFVESPFEADGVTERFSEIISDLDEIKIKRGLVEYYANYLNNPLPPETQLFSESSLHLFEYSPDEYRECRHYAYWDPASTNPRPGRDPDYHCMPVVAMRDGYADVVDVWMRQAKPSAGYSQAVTFAKAYSITTFGVELNHLPDAEDVLNDRFRAAGLACGVAGWKNSASKDARIQSMEPLVSGGRIRFRSDWRECSAAYRLFVEQITMYPVASHDDAPDALEGIWRVALAGSLEPAEVRGDVDDGGDYDEFTEDFNSIWQRGNYGAY